MPGNALYRGDNLKVLREYIRDQTIDLVYLDPPFKSNQDYNILFREQNGSRSAAQIKAFTDTWRWDRAAAEACQEVIEAGGAVSRAMQAFRTFLGENDMMAYLAMMAPRLKELHRVLKPTGSLYLHCDPTASHYLKMLMDAVFGPACFCNEIIWHYRKWPSGKYTFQRNHDILLFYSRSETRERTFNQLYMDRAPSTLKRFGRAKIISGYDATGKRIPSQTNDEESKGVRQDDVWDIGRVPPIKQLFPTQKPQPLLERIVAASSDKGQVVLDPFCGCGTTIAAAQKLGRPWIGIDITHLAIALIKHRLHSAFGRRVKYDVIGEPQDLASAEALAHDDRFQFQWWIVGRLAGHPVEKKKGADKGVDGRIYFHDKPGGETKQIIISVKSGHVNPGDVRELDSVVSREKAEIGCLVTLQPATKGMLAEAAGKGLYVSPWGRHPRLQILAVSDILEGKDIDYPVAANITLKRSDKITPDSPAENDDLPGVEQ
jgi:DNA modification methylase